MTINITSISGQHIYQESGTPVVIASGLHVSVSGQHVYVESGVHVISDIQVEVSSGLWVDGISGQHVYVESGVHVIAGYCIGPQGIAVPTTLLTDCNGQLFVWVSGQHVFVESGVFLASGQGGTPAVMSGQNIIVESGLGVLISGQHVYVESGLHVVISGQHVHLESGDTINVYVISGSELQLAPGSDVRLIDQSGHYAYIGRRHEGLVTEGFAINEVHKGEMYRVCTVVSGLAAGGHAEMLISPASGLELHLVFSAGAEALAHVRLWEDVQFTASGAAMTPVCLNRFTSGQPNSVFALTPTITDHGNMLYCDVIGAVGKFGGQAGISRTDIPWILQNVSGMLHSQSGVTGLWYLFEIINQDADPADSSISVEFSEEEPI